MPKAQITATDPAIRRLVENIDKLMDERGFKSRNKLAKAAGVDGVTLHRLWNGDQHPQDGTIEKLADILKVTPAELWGKTARPAPEPTEDEVHPGRQPVPARIKIRDSALAALAMTGMRYRVSYGTILEAAPLLFCLAAEASLKRRRQRLSDVLGAIDTVGDASINFPHVPRSGFFRWYEALDVESASINRRDLFAKDVDDAQIHEHSDGPYDDTTDNPFVRYLADWAAELDIGIEVRSWASWGDPDYEVCREQALEYVGGNEEAADFLLSGHPPLTELVKKVGSKGTPDARAEYVIARGREHKEEMEAEFDALMARAAEAAKDMPDEDEEGGEE